GTKARDAWKRIRRLEEALSLDPHNAEMLTSIGEVYLYQLERPREAERFIRDALRIDPTDKARQALLFKAIRARSLFYRTLCLPMNAARAAWSRLEQNPLRIITFIILIHPTALFICWVVAVGAFFTPAAKMFEWLVLADLPRSRPLPRWLSTPARVF